MSVRGLGPDPTAARRRLRCCGIVAVAVLFAMAAGAAYLAAEYAACTGGAGGLVIHDARGQPRLAIGLAGRCEPRHP